MKELIEQSTENYKIFHMVGTIITIVTKIQRSGKSNYFYTTKNSSFKLIGNHLTDFSMDVLENDGSTPITIHGFLDLQSYSVDHLPIQVKKFSVDSLNEILAEDETALYDFKILKFSNKSNFYLVDIRLHESLKPYKVFQGYINYAAIVSESHKLGETGRVHYEIEVEDYFGIEFPKKLHLKIPSKIIYEYFHFLTIIAKKNPPLENLDYGKFIYDEADRTLIGFQHHDPEFKVNPETGVSHCEKSYNHIDPLSMPDDDREILQFRNSRCGQLIGIRTFMGDTICDENFRMDLIIHFPSEKHGEYKPYTFIDGTDVNEDGELSRYYEFLYKYLNENQIALVCGSTPDGRSEGDRHFRFFFDITGNRILGFYPISEENY